MSKWTIEKIEKQVKFGDFVSIDGDDFNKRIFVRVCHGSFVVFNVNDDRTTRWEPSALKEHNFKFFDRQGKEILPEPEYKYVNFDSFGELCEAIINGVVIYDKEGEEIVTMHSLLNLDHIKRWGDTFYKRVEV